MSEMLEKITSGKHHDQVEDKYRPSAPISTGTIPRRCSKLPPEEFGGELVVHLSICSCNHAIKTYHGFSKFFDTALAIINTRFSGCIQKQI